MALKSFFSPILFLVTVLFVFEAEPSHSATNVENEAVIHIRQSSSNEVSIGWPISPKISGVMILNLESNKPLIRSIELIVEGDIDETVGKNLDPVMALTIG